jgi:hypothetical protein
MQVQPNGDMVRVVEGALPPALFRSARRAVARLGTERLRESYFTTFWLPRGATPAHAVEEAVAALWPIAAPGARCTGAEWWIGRSYTTVVPIGFHFDQDVKARSGLRHPILSSVLFFNRVRGGHLAVTDQRPGPRGEPRPRVPGALQAVAPAPNRYAVFDGRLFHGVLDAEANAPGRRLPGPRGRLRVTLVVNFWARRPTGVPEWRRARSYRALAEPERGGSNPSRRRASATLPKPRRPG